MDQPHPVDEQNIEDYVLGRLSPAEAEKLEEHLFDCPDCLERLHVVDRYQQAVKEVAREEANVEGSLGSPLHEVGRTPSWMTIAAALLLIAIPAYLLGTFFGLGLDSPLDPASVRLFELSPERSASSTDVASVVIAQSTKPREWIVLALDTGESSFDRYEAVLERDAVVWREELRRAGTGRVSLGLPSTFLEAGRYRLTLRGLSTDGHRPLVASFSFEVQSPIKIK